MSKTVIPSQIPTPPKNRGLNRKFCLALLGLFLLFILLLLFFLHHTQTYRRVASDSLSPLNTEVALRRIERINTENENTAHIAVPVRAFEKSAGVPAVKTTPVTLSSEELQMAGNAPLLVYHRDGSIRSAALKANVSTITPNAVVSASSIYTLKAGTILPATLLTGIQSDLPGTLIAKVRRDVFDTATGQALLIPQGSTLIGQYNASMAFGQSRIFIVWSQLVFPNGRSLPLMQLPGVDLKGQSGLHDQVNHHYAKMLGAALFLSLFSGAHQLAQPASGNTMSASQFLEAAMDQQLSETSMQWIEKNMSLPPTNTIRPGANFNVLLTHDMSFPHAYHF